MLIIVTIASLLLALVTSVIAWRIARAERQRSAARVEALARDIHGRVPVPTIDELPLRPVIHPAIVHEPSAVQTRSMFAGTVQTGGTGSRWGLALAIGAFAVASAAALLIVLGNDAPGTRIAIASGAEQAPPAKNVPLELSALSHERDGNRLMVRGVVRNPAVGKQLDRLIAVVVVFNDGGSVVATARAPVTSSALIAGGESTFSVVVPEVSDIARYRVSFRSGDQVVEHVDRRSAS